MSHGHEHHGEDQGYGPKVLPASLAAPAEAIKAWRTRLLIVGARCTPITLRGIPTPNPDCYTTGTYGEQGLGANPNAAFGTATVPTLDPNFKREYNLQYTVGLQQELARGITLNVNWYRRSAYQQAMLVNTAVGDSFWTKTSMVNPLDGTSIPIFNLTVPTTSLPAAKFYQTNAPRSKAGDTSRRFRDRAGFVPRVP